MRTVPGFRAAFPIRTLVHGAAVARSVGDLRRPEHYYVGRRSRGTEVYVVSAAAIEPLEHHERRGRAPFDWGSPSPGARELAFAMLVHGTNSRPPDAICATFWTEVVARLERPGFVLRYGDLALWLLTAFCERDGSPPRYHPGVRDRIGWARFWTRRG